MLPGKIPGFVLIRPGNCCGSPDPAPALPVPLSHCPKKAVPCSCFPQLSSPGRTALPSQALHSQWEPSLCCMLLKADVVFRGTAGLLLPLVEWLMKIWQRAVSDVPARSGSGADPCRIRAGKETHGGKQLRVRVLKHIRLWFYNRKCSAAIWAQSNPCPFSSLPWLPVLLFACACSVLSGAMLGSWFHSCWKPGKGFLLRFTEWHHKTLCSRNWANDE